MENWLLIATNDSLQLLPREICVSFKKKGYVLLKATLRHYRHIDHGQTNTHPSEQDPRY